MAFRVVYKYKLRPWLLVRTMCMATSNLVQYAIRLGKKNAQRQMRRGQLQCCCAATQILSPQDLLWPEKISESTSILKTQIENKISFDKSPFNLGEGTWIGRD